MHYLTMTQGRTNVLLLGDLMGDPNMIKGFPNARNYIKIGFLNYKVGRIIVPTIHC